MRLSYDPLPGMEEQRELNEGFTSDVTADEVGDAAKSTSVHSTAGPDRVWVRMIKQFAVQELTAVIISLLRKASAR